VPHQPGELDGTDVEPRLRLWRAIDLRQRGKRFDKVSTLAFRSTALAIQGNCLSLCVRGDDWTDDHKVDWLERNSPGHGVAEVTAEQVLASGFAGVVWAERNNKGGFDPGHVQATYPKTKGPREDAIEAVRDCASIIRDPEGWQPPQE
jgi:hypothetical protein